MTTRNEAREALYLQFQTVWTPTGYPFVFDNESFTPPDTPWARFSVRYAGAPQDTIGSAGNRRFLRTGSAFTQIFVPTQQGAISTGTKPFDTLSKVVTDGFEGATLSGVNLWFVEVAVRESGPDGKFFSGLVEATFRHEEIR
jgi:hypothetical protein